ncbi:MAG: hypothetical protein WCW68_01650 [Methanothrix sp.]|jgi:hypothetical protein
MSEIMKKLPLISSPKKVVRIVGYVVYGFLALIVLGALAPSDDMPKVAAATEKDEDCIGDTEFCIQTEDVLMQTGYFKSANLLIVSGEARLEVEPSTAAYGDPENFKPLLYSAIERAPSCLGIEVVKLTVKLTDYDMEIRYPFSAASNHTEDSVGSSRIVQR